jgi:hypothetical protein
MVPTRKFSQHGIGCHGWICLDPGCDSGSETDSDVGIASGIRIGSGVKIGLRAVMGSRSGIVSNVEVCSKAGTESKVAILEYNPLSRYPTKSMHVRITIAIFCIFLFLSYNTT